MRRGGEPSFINLGKKENPALLHGRGGKEQTLPIKGRKIPSSLSGREKRKFPPWEVGGKEEISHSGEGKGSLGASEN